MPDTETGQVFDRLSLMSAIFPGYYVGVDIPFLLLTLLDYESS